MNRTAINPTDWSIRFGFNQAELVESPSKFLFLSGQTAIDDSGAPQHKDDLGAQIVLAMDNVAKTLEGAGMTLSNVVKLTIYTTDIDGAMRNPTVTERLNAAGTLCAQTMIGVDRLALPQLLVEIDATACA
jgi:enamine deaminase RidA (YjgF/YER057c/UK114 family)